VTPDGEGAPGEGRAGEALAGDALAGGVRRLGSGLRSGAFSAEQLVGASLEALAAWEPTLNAVAHLRSDAACAEARTLDAELARGHDRGPLHGIPVAIKDLIDVADAPTGYGSRAGRVDAASRDAELVRRLREAGAVVVAKTNLLEYAYGAVHPEVGDTRNPYDPSRTAGGSSGGSAAAVAAGCVPVAVGTDTGGSVRIPAAYCGVVGMKPTPSRVPMAGVFPLAWSLDAAGALARRVEDASLVHDVIEGRPARLVEEPAAGLEGVAIGIPRDWLDAGSPTPAVRAAWEAAVAAAERAGARLVEVSFAAFSDLNDVLLDLLLPEASVIHEEHVQRHRAGYGPATLTQIEAGFDVPAVRYVKARRRQRAARQAFEAWMDGTGADSTRLEVLLSPSVPFQAPAQDPSVHGEEGASEMHFSGPFNLLGVPAAALPWGLANGLPVSVQLTARRDEDAKVFAVARALEALAPRTSLPRLAGES